MDDSTFRRLLESGDMQALEAALQDAPELCNQTVRWGQDQKNESDPLHYVCDCVFNDWLSDAQALSAANLLIEHGASIEGAHGRESPLLGATSLGAESVAKRLIDAGAKLEATSVFGARPLHWAASMGLPETVQHLIDAGAELEARSTAFAATPLFWAVVGAGPQGPNKKRKPVDAARVLLAGGASADTANGEGTSALDCSRTADSGEMYELLQGYL